RVICRLPEVFVPQPQGQRQRLAGLPGILKEHADSIEVRSVNRISKVPVRRSAGSAEVVHEVSKSRKPTARQEAKRATLVERRTLLSYLTQVLAAKAEGVDVHHLRHRLLYQVVIGNSELRYVGLDADRRNDADRDILQRFRLGLIIPRKRELEIDPSKGKASLIGHRRIDYPGVAHK